MESVKDHYDTHLGPIYGWMHGDFGKACQNSKHLFTELQIGGGGKALDLGCGDGVHAIPLAELGFSVHGVDFCEQLLDELNIRSSGLPIVTINADISAFESEEPDSIDLVICMGDTITHLPSFQTVVRLIDRIACWLKPGAPFVLSFRDYFGSERQGVDRFIPVRQDENILLTCFLEYSPESVVVHDIIHRRRGGQWVQSVSSYQKLRIDPAWLANVLDAAGLVVGSQTTTRGMSVIKCVRRCSQ